MRALVPHFQTLAKKAYFMSVGGAAREGKEGAEGREGRVPAGKKECAGREVGGRWGESASRE